MRRRYFEFESMITRDESDLPKVELGTDPRSGMRFALRLSSVSHIRYLLRSIDYYTRLKSPSYERSMIEYKDWYSNEIIRRVTSDASYYEKQSEAKKDVLKEALQRRNKLMNQIQRAMDYYEDNKGQIGKMEKIRAVQQASYPGPMITLTDDQLIFENVTEFGDMYYQFCIKLEKDEKSGEEIPGYGWMQTSTVFGEDLVTLRVESGTTLQLTNSKPRSDVRVLRRGENRASYEFSPSSKELELFRSAGTILYLFHKFSNVSINLSKTQIYSLLEIITTRFAEKTVVKLVFKPSSEFTIRTEESKIVMGLASNLTSKIEISINTSHFVGMKWLLPYLDDGNIQFLNHLFGTLFSFNMGNITINLVSIPGNNSDNAYLRNSIRSYLHDEFKSGNKALFRGNTGYAFSKDEYVRNISDDWGLIDSNRQRKSYIICKYEQDNFDRQDQTVKYQTSDTTSQVTLDKTTLTLNWECSCKSFNPKFKCEHSLAALFLGMQEGILFA